MTFFKKAKPSFSVLCIAALFFISPNVIATCCWSPDKLSPSPEDQEELTGVVTGKSIPNNRLAIKVESAQTVNLTFDKDNGSKQQHKLLYTLSKNDQIKLRYMKNRNAFHIEKIR